MSDVYGANGLAPQCPTKIITYNLLLESCLQRNASHLILFFSFTLGGFLYCSNSRARLQRRILVFNFSDLIFLFNTCNNNIQKRKHNMLKVIVFYFNIRPWATKVVSITIAEWSGSIDSGCFNIRVQTRRLESNGSGLALHLRCSKGSEYIWETQ